MDNTQIEFRIKALKLYVSELINMRFKAKCKVEWHEDRGVYLESDKILKEYIKILNGDIREIESELEFFKEK